MEVDAEVPSFAELIANVEFAAQPLHYIQITPISDQ